MILDGTILNVDINASAGIVDTKLATIATAGKVSNSATTATNANTASAIVARDASGNFTAGTITAALTGAASSNVLKAGDTMTGALVVPLASAATPSLTFTSDLNTGIYSPGADQLAVSTAGTGRLFVGSDGSVGVGGSNLATVPLRVEDTGNGVVIQNAAGGNYAIGLLAGTGSQDAYVYQRANAPLIFGTNNAERLRIDSSGRLLVGTSTARLISSVFLGGGGAIAELQVEGTALAMGSFASNRNDEFGPFLALVKSRGTAAGSFTLVSNGDGIGALSFNGTDGSAALVGAAISAFVDGTPGANDMPGRLVFSTTADGASSPTERMRIDSSGNVGIGTSTPAAALEIANIHGLNNTITRPFIIRNYGQPSATGYGVGMSFYYPNGSNTGFEAASIDSSYTAGGNYGNLIFSTNNNAGVIERMRIDSAGDMLLGATTSLARLTIEKAFGGGTAIDTNTTTASTTYNAAVFRHNSTAVGQIAVSTTATSYITSSDYRLKENVTAVIDGITRLQQLKPSRFNFIADPDHTVDGFIAHEAQVVVPECVTGEKDAVDEDDNPVYQGIDQSKLVPLLTAALQEAIARIETLEAAVAALQSA